jgi:hypothetical protein
VAAALVSREWDIHLTQVGEELRQRTWTGLSTPVAPSDATDALGRAQFTPFMPPRTLSGHDLTQMDIPFARKRVS